MCELLNLDNENRNYLSILEEGQCIIRVNSVKKPFLLKIPYIKNELLTFKEIYRNNSHILEGKRGYNHSISKFKPKNRYSRFNMLVKKLFLLKLRKNETKEPIIMTNVMSGLKGSHAYNISEKDYWEPNLDDLSYENLKKYIAKLDEEQKEKE